MLLNCGVGEDSWESLGLQRDPTSPFWRRTALDVHWKDWCWGWNSNTSPPHAKSWLIGKDPDAGRDWEQKEKGTTEDEMAGQHQWLNAHEFGWTPGGGDRQGGLACCDSWGFKELDMTEQMNWTELNWTELLWEGLPWWFSGKESAWLCWKCGFDLWVGKIPWRRKWQPTLVFLPGKSYEQRSLVGYSAQSQKSRTQLRDWAHTQME